MRIFTSTSTPQGLTSSSKAPLPKLPQTVPLTGRSNVQILRLWWTFLIQTITSYIGDWKIVTNKLGELVAFPLGVMKIFQQKQLTDVFILTHSTKDHPIVSGKSCSPLLKWQSVGALLGSFLPSSTLNLRKVTCSPQQFLGRAPKRMTARKTSLAWMASLKLEVAATRSQQPTQPLSEKWPFCLPGACEPVLAMGWGKLQGHCPSSLDDWQLDSVSRRSRRLQSSTKLPRLLENGFTQRGRKEAHTAHADSSPQDRTMPKWKPGSIFHIASYFQQLLGAGEGRSNFKRQLVGHVVFILGWGSAASSAHRYSAVVHEKCFRTNELDLHSP